jgi:hypothetical protein
MIQITCLKKIRATHAVSTDDCSGSGKQILSNSLNMTKGMHVKIIFMRLLRFLEMLEELYNAWIKRMVTDNSISNELYA